MCTKDICGRVLIDIFNWHLIDISINISIHTWSTRHRHLGQHSAKSQVIFADMSLGLIGYMSWSTLCKLLTSCRLNVVWDADQVSMYCQPSIYQDFDFSVYLDVDGVLFEDQSRVLIERYISYLYKMFQGCQCFLRKRQWSLYFDLERSNVL